MVWKSGWEDWEVFGFYDSEGIAQAWADKLNREQPDEHFPWKVGAEPISSEGPSPE